MLRSAVVAIVLSSCLWLADLAHSQPPGNRGARPTGSTATTTPERIQTQVNQRVQDQAQRRMNDASARSVERRVEATRSRVQTPAQDRIQNQRQSQSRSLQSNASRSAVQEQPSSAAALPAVAAEQARLHSAISEGLRTGKPLQINAEQRAIVREAFGDEALLQSPATDSNEVRSSAFGRRPENARAPTATAATSANLRARLTNAIQVRRTQISAIRDSAIQTNDARLLERADQMEKTLNTFLNNQLRVEETLSRAGQQPTDNGSSVR